MQRYVTIRHPSGGIAEVPASAVPHWKRAGWEVVATDTAPSAEVTARGRAKGRDKD